MRIATLVISSLLIMNTAKAVEADTDPYLWLEDVTGKKALDWVRERNRQSQAVLEAAPGFEKLRDDLRGILDSDARIPYVEKIGAYYYNFWQDKTHPQGLWRRTTLTEYRTAEPKWETVIDLDALSKAEKKNWVWHGAQCRWPDYDRCLIALSRGGSDADVTREFDLSSKTWVRDGFFRPEAKGELSWIDRDTVYVATDFGPGSMTTSGYPRIVKQWKRGTPLAAAEVVYEGQPTDISVGASVSHSRGQRYDIVYRGITFYTRQYFLRENTGFHRIEINTSGVNRGVHTLSEGDTLRRIEVPEDAEIDTVGNNLLIELKSDWQTGGRTWPQGALLAIGMDRFLAGERQFDLLYEPGPRKALAGYTATKNFILVTELDNVKGRLYEWKQENGQWWRRAADVPALGTLNVSELDDESSDEYFLNFTDFLTPTTLYLARAGGDGREKLKALPEFFDASGLEVTQYEAVSKDGTRVPYFQIARKGLVLNGANPTLLYGYGGFEVSLTPSYAAAAGRAWLSQGGVYVLANIRGGGEFGPAWHNAALKENRQRAYDDFIAIGEDLIARKVTSTPHLGIQGGSNGGLLMGVMFTERPDLWGAVVCQVPLLDMKRYSHLLAGASWMGEYGDPDKPEEWAFISAYSPYQNAKADAGYPAILFTTSTRDDRVHPGHARKMMAKLLAQGHDDLLYYENIEGGHGGAANNAQRAYMQALAYAFLRRELF